MTADPNPGLAARWTKQGAAAYVRTLQNGVSQIYQTIRLEDAAVISFRQYANKLDLANPLATENKGSGVEM